MPSMNASDTLEWKRRKQEFQAERNERYWADRDYAKFQAEDAREERKEKLYSSGSRYVETPKSRLVEDLVERKRRKKDVQAEALEE